MCFCDFVFLFVWGVDIGKKSPNEIRGVNMRFFAALRMTLYKRFDPRVRGDKFWFFSAERVGGVRRRWDISPHSHAGLGWGDGELGGCANVGTYPRIYMRGLMVKES